MLCAYSFISVRWQSRSQASRNRHSGVSVLVLGLAMPFLFEMPKPPSCAISVPQRC